MTDPKSEDESVSDSQINEPVASPVAGQESSTESQHGGSSSSSQGKKSSRSSNQEEGSTPSEGQPDESSGASSTDAKDSAETANETDTAGDGETTGASSEAGTPATAATKALRTGYKNLRGAVLIAVVIVGLLSFFLFSHGNSGVNLDKISGKVALSEQDLRDVVASNHLTVYWAGPIAGDKYALIATNPSVIYVRYLPGGVGVNDLKTPMRTIGTYVQKNAFAVARYTGAHGGNIGMNNADGNAVFYSPARDTNVYIGIKGKDIQIEVYDPIGGQALGLVLIRNQIRQIM